MSLWRWLTMKLTNRKFWLFLISLAAVIVLSILSKDASAVIGLFSVYCVGNVASKFRTKNYSIEKLEENDDEEDTGHLQKLR